MQDCKSLELRNDLIVGADEIAAFLGMTRRQIYGCAEHGHLPTFKIGAHICARRSAIMAFIERRENASPGPLP